MSREAAYMQGGLQIFDLKAVREERIFKEAIQFALDHPDKCEMVDQDALNVALDGRWQVLDWRWNVTNIDSRQFPKPFYIRHHGGGSKPWTADKSLCEPYLVRRWKDDLADQSLAAQVCDREEGSILPTVLSSIRATLRKTFEGRISRRLRKSFSRWSGERQIRRYGVALPAGDGRAVR